MRLAFSGPAKPLSQEGIDEAARKLGVGPAEIWTVLTVETKGCGFLADRRPAILFERHIFSKRTDGRYDTTHPDISNPKPGGYRSGTQEYGRLGRAIALAPEAAVCSASWGIAQIMGFNAGLAGYDSAEEMITAMVVSEDNHLLAMARLISHNGLTASLGGHDWARFAKGYNGPQYARNKYDVRLSDAYKRFSSGSFPDLTARGVQMYLTYLGYDPGPVDGAPGRLTRAAVEDFQVKNGLEVSGKADLTLLSLLEGKVDTLCAGG
jgi:hypothetical protein